MPPDEREPSRLRELTYELKVEEAMTREVVTVSPSTSIADLRAILRDRRISGTPVVQDDQLVGIISLENFIKCLAQGETRCPIGEKMTRSVETVYSDEPLVFAVNKFERYGYGRFPVLDRDTGKLVGILTKWDVIHCLLRRIEANFHERERQIRPARPVIREMNADGAFLSSSGGSKGETSNTQANVRAR